AAVRASELLGIATVGLDAVSRHLRHERGSDDVAVNAEASELPVQHVASGARLVVSLLTASGRLAIVPNERTSRPSAIATAMVSACTSMPRNRAILAIR